MGGRNLLGANGMKILALIALFAAASDTAMLGVRPAWLVDQMAEGPLKDELLACIDEPLPSTDWSIGHRGAPLQFPEHSRQSYIAAARQGAGIIECDVTFTKDRQLVCRHAQCDLHRTTDILIRPELAAKCRVPFTAATDDAPASATCCASDLTVSEFKLLNAKMDSFDPTAKTAEAAMGGNPTWRTEAYNPGEVLTHSEAIALIQSFGRKHTPELKSPEVAMPFDGPYTQEDYASALIADYVSAGVSPEDVYPQSFDLNDVLYWIDTYPEFGRQAVFLDPRGDAGALDPNKPSTFSPSMEELHDRGVRIIAPPLWMLLTLNDGRIAPSAYAQSAKTAGLDVIAWTVERSGTLADSGGYYFQSVAEAIDGPGDLMTVLDVLYTDIGVRGVFSDWPATTTFFAGCKARHEAEGLD